MKIAIVSVSLSEKMGYSVSFLPKALAELGHEVHLVTSNTQTYYSSPEYKEIFEKFIGPGIVDCCRRQWNGFTLHRLPYKLWPRRSAGIRKLFKTIREIDPDIVLSFGVMAEPSYELALMKPFFKYKFFVESHLHASVFPPEIVPIKTFKRWLYWKGYRFALGKVLDLACEKCLAISTDAADIAVKYFGFAKDKAEVMLLGTDTQLFTPWYEKPQEERKSFRQGLGLGPEHIVCIYTGRLHEGKDPLILARAIDALNKQGKAYRGIFVGDGPQEYIESIKKNTGCSVVPFVPIDSLPNYYQAADIAVWPKQESTSQLDAAACGLPLILSSRVHVVERVEGNGLLYEENNVDDLIRKLLQLENPELRRKMGEIGVANMRAKFSWQKIAQKYVDTFQGSIR